MLYEHLFVLGLFMKKPLVRNFGILLIQYECYMQHSWSERAPNLDYEAKSVVLNASKQKLSVMGKPLFISFTH